jgi:hypothetical protein
MSATSLPPPLPTKIQKLNQFDQNSTKIATSQQTQFQTLRPVKTQSNAGQNVNLRRSESNEVSWR